MSLNICSHNHDEICFEGNNCPLCSAQDEIDSLAEDLASAQREIDELKKEE